MSNVQNVQILMFVQYVVVVHTLDRIIKDV